MQAANNAAGKHISASNHPTSSPNGLASRSHKGIPLDNRTLPLSQLQTSPCALLTTTSTEQTPAHPPALYGTVNTLLSVRKVARILRKSSRLDGIKVRPQREKEVSDALSGIGVRSEAIRKAGYELEKIGCRPEDIISRTAQLIKAAEKDLETNDGKLLSGFFSAPEAQRAVEKCFRRGQSNSSTPLAKAFLRQRMPGQTPTLITLVTESPHSNGETPSIRPGGHVPNGAGNPSTTTISQAEQGPTIFPGADPQPGPELDEQLQASDKRIEGHSAAPGGSNIVPTNVNDGNTGTTTDTLLLEQAAGTKTSLIKTNGPRAASGEEVSWIHIVYRLLFGLWTPKNGD